MIRNQYKLKRLIVSLCLGAMSGLMFTFVADLGLNDCDCSQVADASIANDRGELHKPVIECCSNKVATAQTSPCCCNPEATECLCGGCSCRELDDSPLPAAPIPPGQQTIELVFVCVVGHAPRFDGSLADDDTVRTAVSHQSKGFTTSQQMCVFLSRFNC